VIRFKYHLLIDPRARGRERSAGVNVAKLYVNSAFDLFQEQK
jgi:hypothetical protein